MIQEHRSAAICGYGHLQAQPVQEPGNKGRCCLSMQLWRFLSHELLRSWVLPSHTSAFLSYHLEYSAFPRFTGGFWALVSPRAAQDSSATRPRPHVTRTMAPRTSAYQQPLEGLRVLAAHQAPVRGPAHCNHPQCCSGGCASSCRGAQEFCPSSLLSLSCLLAVSGCSFCHGLHQAESLPPKKTVATQTESLSRTWLGLDDL